MYCEIITTTAIVAIMIVRMMPTMMFFLYRNPFFFRTMPYTRLAIGIIVNRAMIHQFLTGLSAAPLEMYAERTMEIGCATSDRTNNNEDMTFQVPTGGTYCLI